MPIEQNKPIVINVYGDPPTVSDIAMARQAIAEATRGDLSLAEKVAIFCPIPVLDVLAALATHAVESAWKEDPALPLRDAPDGLRKDWSSSDATRSYVEKVRAQARSLLQVKVETLEAHLSTIDKARELGEYAVYLGKLSSELLAKAGTTLFGRDK